ncbi:hypothetical protein J1N35_029709 [Gossypium stocksii]|uniref:Uncharacterized protein n=1 Tax=Gossypium stocksii TaxID=47602 RepID=A0A9D3UZA3_9ROSI|nr:hypothetical protein J1N35_029709 [Gossypium stocksii]
MYDHLLCDHQSSCNGSFSEGGRKIRLVQRNYKGWGGVIGHWKKLLCIPLRAIRRMESWINI